MCWGTARTMGSGCSPMALSSGSPRSRSPSRVATVRGWHRRFCLWQWRFRGTRDCPGVMLALDRGGSCVGIVYKVTGPDLPSKIMPVWRREMRGNGYLARRVSVITAEGPVRAMTFVVNRASERYAGRLSDQEIAACIAIACGQIGPSAEYRVSEFKPLGAGWCRITRDPL